MGNACCSVESAWSERVPPPQTKRPPTFNAHSCIAQPERRLPGRTVNTSHLGHENVSPVHSVDAALPLKCDDENVASNSARGNQEGHCSSQTSRQNSFSLTATRAPETSGTWETNPNPLAIPLRRDAEIAVFSTSTASSLEGFFAASQSTPPQQAITDVPFTGIWATGVESESLHSHNEQGGEQFRPVNVADARWNLVLFRAIQ